MIERRQIFINGKWVSSSASDVITVINPVTEESIATVPRGSAEDVDRAARAAAAAFAGWSQSSVQDRVEVFAKLARLTEARSEEITRTIVSELGQPARGVARAQTAGAVEELDIIAESLRKIAWSEQVGNTLVRREPSGVVGAITAWNAPLRSIISKAGAAMAAGCTIVCKPAEIAPLTAFIFAEMMAEAGVPDGVFNLVCGTGPEVGEAIVIANDSPYGLAAGVWCGDADRARVIATRLRVGRIRINGAPLDKRGTHGGFKLSGIGREWGRFGIEEFIECKSVIG